jgi:phosphoribosylformylglycinamidine synthase
MNAPVSSEALPLHRSLGLTDDEYARIEEVLGRAPNRAELAMYSVMWSEHCSYKSSRIHLRHLPTDGPQVLVGPGEGAGVIDVDGVAVAIRIESHNHPSFVEPVQGAATGIGGIVRDVLSVGARPVALLDPLRFGPLPAEGRGPREVAERNRYLVEGVVSGISSYGNSIGVPTVGGEMVFDDCYSGNPLVNVMCIGVAPAGRIILARAEGVGNRVLLLGSSTGRDGIGGVSVLASASFDAGGSGAKRPSVQVGDPFTEKLLIEACLELIEKGLVVGVQDLGGAGLCCATSESAARAGNGMRIDIAKVTRREPGMEPFEVLISESQERMLVIVRPEHAGEALAVCEKWGLGASEIGEVTEGNRFVVVDGGEPVADVPAASLGDGPEYDRPRRAPVRIAPARGLEAPTDTQAAFIEIIASPNVCSKRWAWEQYDHQVMLGTVVRPGHDAAVLRIPGAASRIAVTADCNARFCAADPYLGAQHAVAEAARNLSVAGAEPAAVTNCLNFGSPEDPEVMWQFAETVRGMGEACRALGVPVVSGNVSFYNSTGDAAIHPTPIIGMVGVIPAGVASPPLGFGREGDHIFLLGKTEKDLGGSEYERLVAEGPPGPPPLLDLGLAAGVGRAIRKAIAEAIVTAAHDCSQGGLAAALAEMCVAGMVGARVMPEPGLEPWVWLFSESPSRIVVATEAASAGRIREIAEAEGVPVTALGTVGGPALEVEGAGTFALEELGDRYENTFARAMGYSVSPQPDPVDLS